MHYETFLSATAVIEASVEGDAYTCVFYLHSGHIFADYAWEFLACPRDSEDPVGVMLSKIDRPPVFVGFESIEAIELKS